ncbi:MAG: hypothetical protein KKH91_05990, partial [Elusimicrobia bacterium]|nr:hypothetical protein [Elusimicrobiota bacterium]
NTQKARVTVPLEEFAIASDEQYDVIDLLTGKIYTWQGRDNMVILDPQNEPAVVFKLEKL